MAEFRLVFNSIPEIFDKGRTTYCPEAFADIIAHSALGNGRSALEIGPGTGQATEPILKTGCDYTGVELGHDLASFMRKKFNGYANCSVVVGDFTEYDFGEKKFDLVYSAATIQWIPENLGFPRAFSLLKSGGSFAMMYTSTDEKSANPELREKKDKVYAEHFRPTEKYQRGKLRYENAVNYGFVDMERREYPLERKLSAAEYIGWLETSAEHITITEPEKSRFYDGIAEAVNAAGGIELRDTIVLYLMRKP